MTKKELQYIKKVLERIKNPDQHIEKAIAYVDKDLKHYESQRGQLRDNYDTDYNW